MELRVREGVKFKKTISICREIYKDQDLKITGVCRWSPPLVRKRFIYIFSFFLNFGFLFLKKKKINNKHTRDKFTLSTY